MKIPIVFFPILYSLKLKGTLFLCYMSAPFEFDSRLDTGFLDSLYEGDMDYAMRMFEFYVRIYPAKMEKCREVMLSEGDTGKAGHIHGLSDFPVVGLKHLANMRDTLQLLFRKGDTTTACQQFPLLEKEFHRTFPLIEEEYNRLKDFVQQYSKR